LLTLTKMLAVEGTSESPMGLGAAGVGEPVGAGAPKRPGGGREVVILLEAASRAAFAFLNNSFEAEWRELREERPRSGEKNRSPVLFWAMYSKLAATDAFHSASESATSSSSTYSGGGSALPMLSVSGKESPASLSPTSPHSSRCGIVWVTERFAPACSKEEDSGVAKSEGEAAEEDEEAVERIEGRARPLEGEGECDVDEDDGCADRTLLGGRARRSGKEEGGG
jgi:hypothetical protein